MDLTRRNQAVRLAVRPQGTYPFHDMEFLDWPQNLGRPIPSPCPLVTVLGLDRTPPLETHTYTHTHIQRERQVVVVFGDASWGAELVPFCGAELVPFGSKLHSSRKRRRI